MKRKGGAGCLIVIILLALCVWGVSRFVKLISSPEFRARVTQRAAEKAEAHKAERAARTDEEIQFRATAQTLSVDEIVSYYAVNEVAGDEALKGKWLKVRGIVDRVGKDILDSPFVAFKGPEATFRTVQCMFDKSQVNELSSLRPGDHVVIFGRCKGLMMNILMDECEFDVGP